jgi:hypothetical protein
MSPLGVVVYKAMTQVDDYDMAMHAKQQHVCSSSTSKLDMKWLRPLENFVKVNWDTSLDIKDGYMGVGIIARSHDGGVLVSYCDKRPYISEAASAEVLAMKQAVEICEARGW